LYSASFRYSSRRAGLARSSGRMASSCVGVTTVPSSWCRRAPFFGSCTAEAGDGGEGKGGGALGWPGDFTEWVCCG